MKVVYFLCLCFLFYCVDTNDCPREGTDEVRCTSINYPDPYKNGICFCNFSVESGYEIEVNIEYLNLSSNHLDYLLLTTDTDDLQYKFTWYLDKPKKLLIGKSDVSLMFVANDDNEIYPGFSVRLKRHGELTTTPESTTIVIWPKPNENETIYYTVNISTTAIEFEKRVQEFKLRMANMTNKYCKDHIINLAEEATEENINIDLAIQCPIEWPNNENCVQVRYAIPVFLKDSNKYQLTANHLNKMWEEYASEELSSLQWKNYEIPDNSYSMLIWLVLSLIVLVTFLVILYFVRTFSLRFGRLIKRRSSDAQHIIATPNRVSDASLWPTSSQQIPPLFENENSYIYYEPDSAIKSSQMRNVATNNMLNANDSSDEENILTIRNSTATGSYSQNVIQLEDDHSKESAL